MKNNYGVLIFSNKTLKPYALFPNMLIKNLNGVNMVLVLIIRWWINVNTSPEAEFRYFEVKLAYLCCHVPLKFKSLIDKLIICR